MKQVILLSALMCAPLVLQAADSQYTNLELFENERGDLEVIREPQAAPEPQASLYDRFVSACIPQQAIKETAGAAAGEMAKRAAEEADQFTKENIALMDETIRKHITRFDKVTSDWADRVGDRFDQSIDRTQELTVLVAQNIAKTALVSIKGCFGAVLAYKNLMLYLEEQNHNDDAAQSVTVKSSRARIALTVTGVATFASACLLAYYWIR